MKTSVKWLSKYVDMPWGPAELAERLTLAGLEVEEIVTTGAIPDGVVVAEILARRPHPNADRLSVCEVRTADGVHQVVCGAPNCDAGVRVPMATVGTCLPGGLKIKRAKLRGVESEGMLCSARELGLGEDASGLLHLPAEAPVGRPLSEIIAADTVIDWDVTPNRPDWLCHVGIAREIAAVAGCPERFRLPVVDLRESAAVRAADLTAVEVRDPDLCPRYTARIVRGVRIAPSPAWLQKALEAVGVRPINNVVDITNFVMMECGQPLHAFDYERLAGHRIVVRRAAEGEVLVTLDGKSHTLSREQLLIADAERGVALAGVMGGANSEITDATTTVLLESAAFLPGNIRATAKRLGASSESAYRFERGVDPEMTAFASARATALIAELAGGEVATGMVDVYAKPYVPRRIRCRFARVCQLLGVELSAAEITACLTRLGLGAEEPAAESITAVVPPFRPDLEREVDLIEEVARIHGLDRIPPEPAPARVGGPRAKDAYYVLEDARREFLGLGLDEAMNYSLLSQKLATDGTGVTPAELVMLANPISAEGVCMRPSVLPGLLATVARNVARQSPDLALFELGRVLVHRPGTPEERWQVGIALTGRVHPERFGDEGRRLYDFYDLKGLLEGWLRGRGVTGLACRPTQDPALTAGAGAELLAGDVRLAVLGEVSPDLTRDMRLTAPLFVALVELDAMLRLPAPARRLAPLPQFPSTARDTSMSVPAAIPSQAIIDAIREQACPWLEHVALFDIFQDEQSMGQGKRCLAYSLTYRHPERTLTDDEVNREHERIKAKLAERFPIQYR